MFFLGLLSRQFYNLPSLEMLRSQNSVLEIIFHSSRIFWLIPRVPSIHKVMILKSVFLASTLPLTSRHDYTVPSPFVPKTTGNKYPKLNHYFFLLKPVYPSAFLNSINVTFIHSACGYRIGHIPP